MNCAKCSGVSLNAINIHGIEIDQCPSCSGIWFDKAELSRLLREEVDDLRPLTESTEKKDLNHIKGHCPKDGDELFRVCSGRNHHVVVEICGACQGVWLDGGEFAAILGKR